MFFISSITFCCCFYSPLPCSATKDTEVNKHWKKKKHKQKTKPAIRKQKPHFPLEKKKHPFTCLLIYLYIQRCTCIYLNTIGSLCFIFDPSTLCPTHTFQACLLKTAVTAIFWHFCKCNDCSCRSRRNHGLLLAVPWWLFMLSVPINGHPNKQKLLKLCGEQNCLKTKCFVSKNSLVRKKKYCNLRIHNGIVIGETC